MTRHKTKEVRIGNCVIGGNNPIAIQSMTNTHTEDVDATGFIKVMNNYLLIGVSSDDNSLRNSE